MIIDGGKYGGRCACGRTHAMATRLCVIAPGCLAELDDYMRQYGLSGRRCAVYGSNSYRALEGARPRAEQEIVLDSAGLHATELSTGEVSRRLAPDTEVLLAVGSGTIHDIVRYCAAKHGLRFVSIPTAASVDGFCSTVAAMTWQGYKRTLSAAAPELVVADLRIIAAAPARLTASGVGDMLGKYTALADWRIAHAVTGEAFCPVICGMMREATDLVFQNCLRTRGGEPAAFEAIVRGLLLSGLAMQMMGNSRPASGAEHHISHVIETAPAQFGARGEALHGEKVGVGTLLAAEEYRRLAQIEDIAPFLVPYAPLDRARMRAFFGEALYPACDSENKDDCLAAVTPEAIAAHWDEIRAIVADIPAPETLFGVLSALDAKKTLPDIGVDGAMRPLLLDVSPVIRNRLTLMRMRRMIRA